MNRANESSREQIIQPSSPDRLSDLPDSLLCHILSFLPTKLSVSTSILARRWRFIWTDVPVLDFNSNELFKPRNEMSIPDIINMVMQLNNVLNINTFRLSLREWYYDDEGFTTSQVDTWIDTWVRNVIARKVQALDLHLDTEFRLHHCIFTCNTLVSLRLAYVDLRPHGCEGVPRGHACFPSLKKLYLSCVQYEVDETLPLLLSGCPVLEELEIDCISYLYIGCCIIISSPTIKWLKLLFYFDDSDLVNEHVYKLEINTPALRYLHVDDHLLKRISAGTLNSLVEADICLDYDRAKDDALYSRSVLDFVDKLCHVKHLTLLSDFKQIPNFAFAAAPTRFHNLTKLELSADWRFLIKFLESADNLAELLIREGFKSDDEYLKCWVEPKKVPMCLSSHLREVTIYSFECLDDEFKMVSYILKNAKVLNTMDICDECVDHDLKEKSILHQRISEFERGSETSTLVVKSPNPGIDPD